MSEEPIYRARDLVKIYPRSGAQVRAVDGVNLEINAGERLGIVGGIWEWEIYFNQDAVRPISS